MTELQKKRHTEAGWMLARRPPSSTTPGSKQALLIGEFDLPDFLVSKCLTLSSGDEWP